MAPEAGEHEAEAVEQLRRRAEGAADAGDARALVQSEGGGNVPDLVHLRLARLCDPAAGIGGKRLQIPARALRIQRSQRQRRLPRAGDARNGDQLAERNVHIDVFQIMHLRTAHDDVLGRLSFVFQTRHTAFPDRFHDIAIIRYPTIKSSTQMIRTQCDMDALCSRRIIKGRGHASDRALCSQPLFPFFIPRTG